MEKPRIAAAASADGAGRRRGLASPRRGGGEAQEGATRILYIGRVPHGFYEDQMRGFFSQFGVVTRLRLSRNKKTGHSKHYAFVEFKSPEVAAIVAETMHNYLVAGHMLQVRLLPPSRRHPMLWKGANKKFRLIPRQRTAREQHNRERTAEGASKQLQRQLRREEERREKIKKAGIQYDFPGLREKWPRASSHINFELEDQDAAQ